MPDLAQCRAQIDALDAQLVALLEARMDVSRAIAREKRARGLPVYQPNREKIVLEQVAARVKDPADAPAVCALYRQIMALSRQCQHAVPGEAEIAAPGEPEAAAPGEIAPPSEPEAAAPMWDARTRVAYPGTSGAFSEEAARRYFGKDASATACPSFDAAAWAVRAGGADYAVLPVENSTTGTVLESERLIEKYGLSIVGEVYVPVRHQLLGVCGARLSDVREVCSHPQAIAQCHEFLLAHSEWRLMPSQNTALSARQVSKAGDPSIAAIASLDAAKKWGLCVLRQDISDAPNNATRFAIVALSPKADPAADKASITFRLGDHVGALARVTGAFAQGHINLIKLESRPVPGAQFTYAFRADLDWHNDRPALERALEAASRDTDTLQLLGLYQKAKEIAPWNTSP